MEICFFMEALTVFIHVHIKPESESLFACNERISMSNASNNRVNSSKPALLTSIHPFARYLFVAVVGSRSVALRHSPNSPHSQSEWVGETECRTSGLLNL